MRIYIAFDEADRAGTSDVQISVEHPGSDTGHQNITDVFIIWEQRDSDLLVSTRYASKGHRWGTIPDAVIHDVVERLGWGRLQ
jgi:hypothetical protein